jgi:hypothetical protein
MADQRQLAVKAPNTNPALATFASNIESNVRELHQITDAQYRELIARIEALEALHS